MSQTDNDQRANHPHAAATLEEPAAEQGLQKRRVLVVDDDPDFLDQQQSNLEALGYEVYAASNETQARKLLADHKPDIALLDLMMDTPDAGFTLCHHIKQTHANIPVILVTSAESITGYDFRSVSSTAKEWMGANAILSKPIRLEELKRELNRGNL